MPHAIIGDAAQTSAWQARIVGTGTVRHAMRS